MTKEELQNKLEGITELAISNFQKDGALTNVFLIEYFNEENIRQTMPFPIVNGGMHELRYEVLKKIGSFFKTLRENRKIQRVEAIISVNECWFVQKTKEEAEHEDLTKVIPSQSPNKKEGIVVAGMSEYDSLIIAYEIIRKPDVAPILEIISKDTQQVENMLLRTFWENFLLKFY